MERRGEVGMAEMTVEDAEAEGGMTPSVAIYILERKAYGPDITASSYQWFHQKKNAIIGTPRDSVNIPQFAFRSNRSSILDTRVPCRKL